MNMYWGILTFRFGNRFRGNIEITQIQPRFDLKLSTDLE